MFCDSMRPTYREDLAQVQAEIDAISARLQASPPFLVGHNVFIDLCYMYKMFIGTLPESVEGFQREIHAVFPRVVDTKYLATHDQTRMHAAANLKECWDELKMQTEPMVVLHEYHGMYGRGDDRDHEAGFDSTYFSRLCGYVGYLLTESKAG